MKLKTKEESFECPHVSTATTKTTESLVFINASSILKTRKPEPNTKADVSDRGRGLLLYQEKSDSHSYKAFRIISTLDLNSKFPLAKSGDQGHHCAAFQRSDTCLNPVEMSSRAKGTDPVE